MIKKALFLATEKAEIDKKSTIIKYLNQGVK